MQPFVFDLSPIAQFFGPVDFLVSGDFWLSLYIGFRWGSIALSIAFGALCAYVLIQIWPLRMRLRIREGHQAFMAPQQRFSVEDTHRVATRKKWEEIIRRVETQGPPGYSISIIEADVLLEHTLGRIGIAGRNIAERLRSLAPDELPNVNAVWEAHALRNRIAHEPNFVPSREETAKALAAYKEALTALDAM